MGARRHACKRDAAHDAWRCGRDAVLKRARGATFLDACRPCRAVGARVWVAGWRAKGALPRKRAILIAICAI
eukprot:6775332-Prymnesium_polylepis.1